MKQVNSSISGVLWDEVQKSPFYEYKVCLPLQDAMHVVDVFMNHSSLIIQFSGLDFSVCFLLFFSRSKGWADFHLLNFFF